jgi:hypothetical protein
LFLICSHQAMRLRDYPYVIVRFACRHCPRLGRYRIAVLAERYGADIDMEEVLEAVSSSCRARSGQRALQCGAYFPDLPPEKPPDLPRALLPRERLKLIRGGRG